MKFLRNAVKAFGMFWWNFLVGDTPELFVACVIILSVVALVAKHHAHVVMVSLPLLVLGTLIVSVRRAQRKR